MSPFDSVVLFLEDLRPVLHVVGEPSDGRTDRLLSTSGDQDPNDVLDAQRQPTFLLKAACRSYAGAISHVACPHRSTLAVEAAQRMSTDRV